MRKATSLCLLKSTPPGKYNCMCRSFYESILFTYSLTVPMHTCLSSQLLHTWKITCWCCWSVRQTEQLVKEELKENWTSVLSKALLQHSLWKLLQVRIHFLRLSSHLPFSQNIYPSELVSSLSCEQGFSCLQICLVHQKKEGGFRLWCFIRMLDLTCYLDFKGNYKHIFEKI